MLYQFPIVLKTIVSDCLVFATGNSFVFWSLSIAVCLSSRRKHTIFLRVTYKERNQSRLRNVYLRKKLSANDSSAGEGRSLWIIIFWCVLCDGVGNQNILSFYVFILATLSSEQFPKKWDHIFQLGRLQCQR